MNLKSEEQGTVLKTPSKHRTIKKEICKWVIHCNLPPMFLLSFYSKKVRNNYLLKFLESIPFMKINVLTIKKYKTLSKK